MSEEDQIEAAMQEAHGEQPATPEPPIKQSSRSFTARITPHPADMEARWETMMDLVEITRTPWNEAFRKAYPELNHMSDSQVNTKIRNWRYRTERFQKFLLKRKKAKEDDKAFPKKKYLDQLSQIAMFNLVDLYEDDGEGSIRLNADWLEIARKRNVINKITCTENTRESKGGEKFTTKTITVSVYSRLDALNSLAKSLGYNGSAPSGIKTETTTNNYLVNMIKQVKEQATQEKAVELSAVKDKKKLTAAPVINQEFIDSLMNAEVVVKDANKGEES